MLVKRTTAGEEALDRASREPPIDSLRAWTERHRAWGGAVLSGLALAVAICQPRPQGPGPRHDRARRLRRGGGDRHPARATVADPFGGDPPAGLDRRLVHAVAGAAPVPILAYPALLVVTWIAGSLVPLPVRAAVAGQSTAAQLVEIIVITQVVNYWSHRLSHEIPWLWRFHRVHHSPEELDWLTGRRDHPIGLTVARVLVTAPCSCSASMR